MVSGPELSVNKLAEYIVSRGARDCIRQRCVDVLKAGFSSLPAAITVHDVPNAGEQAKTAGNLGLAFAGFSLNGWNVYVDGVGADEKVKQLRKAYCDDAG